MSEPADIQPSPTEDGGWSARFGHRRVAIGVGLVALAMRLLANATIGRNAVLFGDAFSYDRFARLMLSGWQWVTTPLVVREPLYPAFMALAYAAPGDDLRALLFLQAVIGALACVFVYLTLRLLVRESIAILAAILIAFNPEFIGFTVLPLRESLIIVILAAFLMTFLAAMQKPGRLRLFVCALFFVLLAHTDVRFLPLVAVFPLMAFAYHRQLDTTFRQTMWFALFFVLLMIPYQIRGYAATGEPVIITERFLGKWLKRATSQISETDPGPVDVAGGKRVVWLRDWESKKQLQLNALTGEERAFFLAGGRPRTDRLGIHWFLFREYWRFARFKPEYRPYPDGRFADPWSVRHNLSSSIALVPFLLFLPFVFVRASNASRRVALPLLIFFAAHAAMHVIVHARARYRIPMEVITSILLAMALVNLWGYLRRREPTDQPLE